jgi:hypothetical protein
MANFNITARITNGTSSAPKKVTVTLPSNSNIQLRTLTDVVTTGIAEGALLQYRESDQKFVARNVIDTPLGQLRLSGGFF